MPVTVSKTTTHTINTYNESPLHAALKTWYAQPGARLETNVDGFIIDMVQNQELIEIQTRNFSAIKQKLLKLTPHHRVRLVHPIAREKWIIKQRPDHPSHLSRRKSPRRGHVEAIFQELVSFPNLLQHPNFSLDVLLIQEEETRRYDPQHSSWRRKGWVIESRRLLKVLECHHFADPTNFLPLIPSALSDPFTTADLAIVLHQPQRLAQKMAYCLRKMDLINPIGKRGKAILYQRASNTD